MIELLAVLAVVLIRVAILLPVIGGVRKQTQRTQNASQLRQLGIAFTLYTQNNGGYGPTDWRTKDSDGVSSNSITKWAWHGKFILFGCLLPYLDANPDGHWPQETPAIFISPASSESTLNLVDITQETCYYMNVQVTSTANNSIAELPANRIAMMDICKWWSPRENIDSHEGKGFHAYRLSGAVTWTPIEETIGMKSWDWAALDER